MEPLQTCPSCRATITETEFFCPQCGKKLKDAPLGTSPGKQLLYYVLSILLPPIGLWWAIKYLRQNDPAAKRIAAVIIALTILSLAANIWAATGIYAAYSRFINSFTNPDFSF